MGRVKVEKTYVECDHGFTNEVVVIERSWGSWADESILTDYQRKVEEMLCKILKSDFKTEVMGA